MLRFLTVLVSLFYLFNLKTGAGLNPDGLTTPTAETGGGLNPDGLS